MALSEYKKKRNFTDTPEPKGEVIKNHKKLEFVIQKHHASRLHYDFRLELDGVLKSWAVPKGPSLDPKVKRLAMQVEDHPYQYRTFEGTIPEGNYGAGNVIIWDKGWYELHREDDSWPASLQDGLKDGDLKFILHGQKLQGSFALIKTPRMGDKAWLLIKHRDKYVSEKDITDQGESVVSGREVDDQSGLSQVSLSSLPKANLSDPVKPMLATLIDEPFSDEKWIFEIKWDGYRALLSKQQQNIKLYSRSGQDFNKAYVEVVQAASNLPKDVLLDGEIVIADETGRGHFSWLQNWQSNQQGQLIYYVFDILEYDGHDLTGLGLTARKRILKEIIPEGSLIKYSDHIEKDGVKFFSVAEKQGLEGVIAKRAASRYQIGSRTKDWLKIKTHQRQEVVVGGFTEPKGSRQYLGSLILGVYDNGEFIYVGHSGGSFGGLSLKELREKLNKLKTKDNPFRDIPREYAKVAHWVNPILVGEVNFEEWTPDGRMRHPKIVGFRQDKKAKNVHREKVLSAKNAK
jgi:bifunctional non-homologous end joining protein LigD